MQSTFIEKKDQLEFLIEILERLVGIIRYENGSLQQLLKRYTAGKSAIVEMDGHRLLLRAGRKKGYLLQIRPDDGDQPPNLSISSLVILDIIAGNITLDQAILEQKIMVRGAVKDVVQMYRLTICILSECPVNREFQHLWRLFETNWHFPATQKPPAGMEQQGRRASLHLPVPSRVLFIRI